MSTSRTVLITGGTGSLGFHTARTLVADRGCRVHFTGRSGIAEIEQQLGTRAVGHRVDLGSLAEVRRFARTVAEDAPLDAVLCNAGAVTVSGLRFSTDGVEATFGVNHLAHFLLVRELLPVLSPGGRVLFVTSATHDPARRTGFPDPEYGTAQDLAHPRGEVEGPSLESGRRRYTASKLCNVLTAYEFARRIPAEVATFNAFDPGQMPGTGLIRDHPPQFGFVWRRLMPALTLVPGINRNTPRRSAAALAALAIDEQFAGVSGRYFQGTSEARSSADSYDKAKATDLWNTSVTLTTNLLGERPEDDEPG